MSGTARFSSRRTALRTTLSFGDSASSCPSRAPSASSRCLPASIAGIWCQSAKNTRAGMTRSGVSHEPR